MIESLYKMDDTVYVLDGTKIVETWIKGVRAEELRQGLDIVTKLQYKVGWGWVDFAKLFPTKQSAGNHLLAINGLSVGVV